MMKLAEKNEADDDRSAAHARDGEDGNRRVPAVAIEEALRLRDEGADADGHHEVPALT